MKTLDFYWNSLNAVSILLLPFAGMFYLLISLRLMLYKQGVFASYNAPVPVIVIGNISVGGTGKTPLIIELVQQLKAKGKKPGVISRGYGGKATSWPMVVSSETTASIVGDEPQLIYQQTACPVVVGPNRQQDIERLLEAFECDVVLADDGLQHYALQRDIEIVVVDAVKKQGNGFFIPAGPMRESRSRLQQVDMVIYNGGQSNQDAFTMESNECKAVSHARCDDIKLTSLSGETVHAVAGIGNPQRFFSMLETYNIKVIPHEFRDHHNFSASDLNFNDELKVLMTEKDAVKCMYLNLPNHWSVPVSISLTVSAQNKVNQIFNTLN